MMREHKDTVARWLSGVLPAIILILVGLFAVMVIRDYGRESDAARQTLLEKGSVLIRALESGTRVGMGMRMHHAQQQTLLEEMAGQPGVLWFAVTDAQGNVVMHSDPALVGKTLYSPAEMQTLHPGEEASWRALDATDAQGKPFRRWRSIVSSSRCFSRDDTGCAGCRVAMAECRVLPISLFLSPLMPVSWP